MRTDRLLSSNGPKKALRWLVAGALLASTASAAAERTATDADPVRCGAEYETIASDAMKRWPVPGLALVVLDGSEDARDPATCISPLGLRSIEDGIAVDPHTLFRMNSLTKAMTATAVARLVDRGELRWTDPIASRLPGFRLSDPWVTQNVTFEDALSHRTDIEANDWLEDVDGVSLDQAITRLRYVPQEDAFRTRFKYDNFMFSVAGVAAGEGRGGWRALIRNELLAPLGLPDARADLEAVVRPGTYAVCHECEPTFAPTGLGAVQPGVNVAAPYIYRDGRLVLDHWRASVTEPAGAVFASAADMARYLRFYLDGGEIDGRRIVSRAGMADLVTPRIVMSRPFAPLSMPENPSLAARDWEFEPQAYALGWELTRYRGYTLVMHRGASMNYQSMVVMVPELHFAFAIMSNVEDGASGFVKALGHTIIDQRLKPARGDWPTIDWVGRALAVRPPVRTVQAVAGLPLSSARAQAYVGRYRHPAYGPIDVAQDVHGTLTISQGVQRVGDVTLDTESDGHLAWRGPRNEPIAIRFETSRGKRLLLLRGQRFVRE